MTSKMMIGTLIATSLGLAFGFGGVAAAEQVAAPSDQPIEQVEQDIKEHSEAAGAAVDEHAEHGEHGEGGHDEHADPTKHYNFFDLGYAHKDQQGGSLEGTEEAMSPPFALLVMNFGVLLIILAWKGGPVVRKMAETRHDEIKNALEEAARLRTQAKAKLDEYSTKLKAAEAEVEQMIKDIRGDAEAEKQRIIAAAEAQAVALKKDAEERIGAEIARARASLQRDVVTAAMTVAERLLRERTTATDQNGLVDKFISDLGKSTAGDRQGRA